MTHDYPEHIKKYDSRSDHVGVATFDSALDDCNTILAEIKRMKESK